MIDGGSGEDIYLDEPDRDAELEAYLQQPDEDEIVGTDAAGNTVFKDAATGEEYILTNTA